MYRYYNIFRVLIMVLFFILSFVDLFYWFYTFIFSKSICIGPESFENFLYHFTKSISKFLKNDNFKYYT